MKTNVVIGGGTAGAISALYMEMINTHRKREVEVVVVKSDDIGIIGAGEGTTPEFVALMQTLGISITDLVRHTNATIKNGIKFTNWTGGGKYDSYMHPFYVHSGIGIHDMHDESFLLTYPGVFAKAYEHKESPDKTDVTATAGKFKKALFSRRAESLHDESADPMGLFRPIANYAIHFDSQVLSEFLLSIAESRGIRVIEGKVKDFVEDEKTGDVTTLILEDGQELDCDFIVDASGMARIFPKAFDAEWVSWKDHLKTDKAITFFQPPTKKLAAYTHATAMDNGWLWEIPLVHRTGCGYVFDSKQISVDEAKAEVEKHFNKEIEINQVLSFEPGYYKQIWNRNVLSVGLSSSFVEPLEATSIWTTIIQLTTLFSSPELMYNPTQEARDWYNSELSKLQEDVASLIYFHYMGRQDEDSSFWSMFTEDNATDRLKELLDIMRWKTLNKVDTGLTTLWAIESWYYVAFGIKYKPLLDSIGRSIKNNLYCKAAENDYVTLKRQQGEVAANVLIGHREMLQLLGATPWEEI